MSNGFANQSDGGFGPEAEAMPECGYSFIIHGQSDLSQRAVIRNRNRRHSARLTSLVANAPAPESFSAITSPEHLLAIFRRLQATAGRAPGSDGLNWHSLTIAEAAGCFRELSRLIQDRTYRPQLARVRHLPKGDGGTREIRIRSVLDRTISKAVHDWCTPISEAILLDAVMAYRPNPAHGPPRRGVHVMLAQILRELRRGERMVIAQGDIRQAFDNVVVDDVVGDFRRIIDSEPMNWLVETILRGSEGQQRSISIDQGDPLSPLALNVRLTYAADHLLQAAGSSASLGWRYADNYVFFARSVNEGETLLAALRNALSPSSLELKPSSVNAVDLRSGRPADILGFGLRSRPSIQVTLTKKAFRGLRERLIVALESPHPAEAAKSTICGWLNHAGPALGDANRTQIVQVVMDAARQYGFDCFRRTELLARADGSRRRWENLESMVFRLCKLYCVWICERSAARTAA